MYLWDSLRFFIYLSFTGDLTKLSVTYNWMLRCSVMVKWALGYKVMPNELVWLTIKQWVRFSMGAFCLWPFTLRVINKRFVMVNWALLYKVMVNDLVWLDITIKQWVWSSLGAFYMWPYYLSMLSVINKWKLRCSVMVNELFCLTTVTGCHCFSLPGWPCAKLSQAN